MKNWFTCSLVCAHCGATNDISRPFRGWIRPTDAPGWSCIDEHRWLCPSCIAAWQEERNTLRFSIAADLAALQRQIEALAQQCADIELRFLPDVDDWLNNQMSCPDVGHVPCGLWVGTRDRGEVPDLPCEPVFGKMILFGLCNAPGEQIAVICLPMERAMPDTGFPLCSGSAA